ncbi:MAG TPA: AzlD domain-containing protein [Bacteriovoracaceae bacterium]|nr:AzlD domain-containing protein [Bacteriovoracaceae bacterium]
MISERYFILNVALLAIGTICIRGSFIALSGKLSISPKVRELFSYIPAAILPALIVPVNFFHRGQVEWLGGKERFLILIVSGVVCYFIRNTLFVIAFGLALLYLVTQN